MAVPHSSAVQYLEQMWDSSQRRLTAEMRDFLSEEFRSAENPYNLALNLARNAKDYPMQKANTLSVVIMSEFSSWLKRIENADRFSVAKKLSFSDQREAFHISTEFHTGLLRFCIDSYDLLKIRSDFVDDIRHLIAKGEIKIAADVVRALDLHGWFRMDELVIPLLLQDKINVAEDYLKKCNREQQLEVVGWLDSLLADSDVYLDAMMEKYQHIPKARIDKLQLKIIEKLVARLSKTFEIDVSYTPNLKNRRCVGSILYLIRRRYSKELTDLQWLDLVEQALTESPEAIPKFLDTLAIRNKDMLEAAKWVKRLGYPIDKLSPELRNFVLENDAIIQTCLKEMDEAESRGMLDDKFLQLPHPENCIVFVDTEDSLRKLIDELQNVNIVGVDSEWRPRNGTFQERLALIQIAFEDRTYLVDTLKQMGELWRKFFQVLLASDHCLKLGFDFGGDLQTIRASFPDYKEIIDESLNVCCIRSLAQHLNQQNYEFLRGIEEKMSKSLIPRQHQNEMDVAESPAEIPSTSLEATPNAMEMPPTANAIPSSGIETPSTAEESCPTNSKVSKWEEQPNEEELTNSASFTRKATGISVKYQLALTDLCNYFLGRPLCKAERFSNWEKRPLRRAQSIYAALDARCQLDIFFVMKAKAEALGIDFDKALEQAKVDRAKNSQNKQRKTANEKRLEKQEFLRQIESLNLSLPTDARPPGIVKCVVDTMLQGLGKRLRQVGVDVVIPENSAAHEHVLDLAREENRYILSMGHSFTAFISVVPEQLLLHVPSNKTAQEQLLWVLEKLKIRVTPEDVFSRCMMCNNPNYLQIGSSLMLDVARNVGMQIDFHLSVDMNRPPPQIRQQMRDSAATIISQNEQFANFGAKSLDVKTGMIFEPVSERTKVQLQIHDVPIAVLKSVAEFFVCDKCGKVYWEGNHFSRLIDKLGDLVEQIA